MSKLFQGTLFPFSSSVSSNVLLCLSSMNLSCETYQDIIRAFSMPSESMTHEKQEMVYSRFIRPFLSRNDSSEPGCVSSSNMSSVQWIMANLGNFSNLASLNDLQGFFPNFSYAAFPNLSVEDLTQVAADPTLLQDKQDVQKIIESLRPDDFRSFYDSLSFSIEANPNSYSEEVKSEFLGAVLNKVNLSSPAINDQEFMLWLDRLRPLISNTSPNLIKSLFNIGRKRDCESIERIITTLDSLSSTYTSDTKKNILSSILLYLKDPTSLKCYHGRSFMGYLRNTSGTFGFPDVHTLVSVIPPNKNLEVYNSISSTELKEFLSVPHVIGNNSGLCSIFNIYNKTIKFLEKEDVADMAKKEILPCVWSLTLNTEDKSQINNWFIKMGYFKFVTTELLGASAVQNSTCAAFQSLVSVMGQNFTFTNSSVTKLTVYTTIKSYLHTSASARCYDVHDKELNSSNWFVTNVGMFVNFATVDDLNGFVSPDQMNVFLSNKETMELFSSSPVSEEVSDFYVQNIFASNSELSVLSLPDSFLCSTEVPTSSYVALDENNTLAVLGKLNTRCNEEISPEVSAALSSNIVEITPAILANMGSASAGFTTTQLSQVSSSVLISALPSLSKVSFNQEKSQIIAQSIISGSKNTTGSLMLSLGTLVSGVTTSTMESIEVSELQRLSQDPTFVSNLLNTPNVLQLKFVQVLITQFKSSEVMVANVPGELATKIPPSRLNFTAETLNTTIINKKTWTSSQASMFFGLFGEKEIDTEMLSTSVLQGFTCTSVRKMKKKVIRKMIRACRPRKKRSKVQLKESQLTCMYNLEKRNLTQNFAEYPSDMLLYFSSANVERGNCKSYFKALGVADFSVSTSILNINSRLFEEAKGCLGISDTSLSGETLDVLGNMCCTLDASYIENSDPAILEKLKTCKGFSDSQVGAMESMLLSGRTSFGKTNSWNKRTLEGLGPLTTFFTRRFWGQYKRATKKGYLKKFMPRLRRKKTSKKIMKRFFKQLQPHRTRRGAGCTVGNITAVTVNEGSFPFGYDTNQFDLCLDLSVLEANVQSICEKVDDDDLQLIVLKKLNELYPSAVPEGKVAALGSVSRSSTLEDISKWEITKADTLAALMKAEDGGWASDKSKAIITKYLSKSGNSLGSVEISSIHSNLCSLDTSTLETITADAVKNASPLSLELCSLDQKKVMYKISKSAFNSRKSDPSVYYNLIKPAIGGASLEDIIELSTQEINMDVNTFRTLDPSVISDLTVTNVKNLLGNQVSDLKMFENEPVVLNWINQQDQVDLDTLREGLISKLVDRTTPAATQTKGKTNKVTGKTTNKVTGKTTNKVNGKTTNKVTGKTTNKVTGKATNKATNKVTGKSTEKVVGMTTKGKVQTTKPPNSTSGGFMPTISLMLLTTSLLLLLHLTMN